MTYYDYITSGEHKKYRRPAFDGRDIAAEFSAEFLPPEERMTRRFEALCANEEAHIFDGQKIVFMRTSSDFPVSYTHLYQCINNYITNIRGFCMIWLCFAVITVVSFVCAAVCGNLELMTKMCIRDSTHPRT